MNNYDTKFALLLLFGLGFVAVISAIFDKDKKNK
jgi:cbb3-type cytochrome oxidase subunit 3|tara:strand:+ start:3031 stop:3132 length:102 start_codon:yes stop_codon:yes gene_type:complete